MIQEVFSNLLRFYDYLLERTGEYAVPWKNARSVISRIRFVMYSIILPTVILMGCSTPCCSTSGCCTEHDHMVSVSLWSHGLCVLTADAIVDPLADFIPTILFIFIWHILNTTSFCFFSFRNLWEYRNCTSLLPHCVGSHRLTSEDDLLCTR